jgi:hypothetical protein
MLTMGVFEGKEGRRVGYSARNFGPFVHAVATLTRYKRCVI